MPTKFGVQPARLLFAENGILVGRAAERIGVARQHLIRALNGRTVPNETVRRKLPVILGVPLKDLFTPEVLATPFGQVGRRPKSGVK